MDGRVGRVVNWVPEGDRYEYRFSAWPEESFPFPRAVFDLFRLLNRQVGMTFTEEEFGRFRADLLRAGITPRGVERVPHHEPEKVG